MCRVKQGCSTLLSILSLQARPELDLRATLILGRFHGLDHVHDRAEGDIAEHSHCIQAKVLAYYFIPNIRSIVLNRFPRARPNFACESIGSTVTIFALRNPFAPTALVRGS